jgi:hypothetical protein
MSSPWVSLLLEIPRLQLKTYHRYFRLTIHRALKSHFSLLEEASDEPGVNEARGYACEYVAWQFVTNLSEREAIDFLLYELLPAPSPTEQQDAELGHETPQNGNAHPEPSEESPLLIRPSRYGRTPSYFGTDSVHASTMATTHSDEFASQFENLSALEIATVSGAKKFLSQRPVQKIINGVWRVRILDVRDTWKKLMYARAILCSGKP